MTAAADYDPMEQAERVIKQIVLQEGSLGADAQVIASHLKREVPTLADLIKDALLVDWVRRRMGKIRDAAQMPWARSVAGRYVQRSFWSADDYRAVIDGYIRRGRENIAVARRLAEEAEQVHGVQIAVPRLVSKAG